MKKLIIIAFLFLALPRIGSADEITASSAVSYGRPLACDTTHQWAAWKNTTGQDVRLFMWKWVPLVALGLRADIQFSLWHYNASGVLLALLDQDSWDHYAEPTLPQSYSISIAPHWKIIRPGDELRVRSRCARQTGPSAYQVVLHFWGF